MNERTYTQSEAQQMAVEAAGATREDIAAFLDHSTIPSWAKTIRERPLPAPQQKWLEERLLVCELDNRQAPLQSKIEMLQAQSDHFEQLSRRLENDRDLWKQEHMMYRFAWLREIGGVIVRKTHEIDGFVLRTREVYEAAQKWWTHEKAQIK